MRSWKCINAVIKHWLIHHPGIYLSKTMGQTACEEKEGQVNLLKTVKHKKQHVELEFWVAHLYLFYLWVKEGKQIKKNNQDHLLSKLWNKYPI